MALDSKPRIGGWLLVPLAWLILTLMTSALVIVIYLNALTDPSVRTMLFSQQSGMLLPWFASLLTSALVGGYSAWLTWLFCKRSHRVPRHYIIWLLVCVLLAIKAFAFSPVSDAMAVRQLIFPLLAAALFVPYFKRAVRVKKTFINP